MATTSLRTTVQARLVEIFTTALATAGVDGGQVPVHWSMPGERATREHVWFDQTDGTVEISAMRAGRKPRIDEFGIDVVVVANSPGSTAQQAAVRSEELYSLLESVIADDPVIGGGITGLNWVRVSRVRGPLCRPTDPAGWRAVWRLTLTCHTRLE